MREPNIASWCSERTSPSPCSPECEPLYSRTIANASSAIARICLAPNSCFRLMTGRTCKGPTDACAYQVPPVPCLWKTWVSRSVDSARSSSSTAQSSMKEIVFQSPFVEIMLFGPPVRADQQMRHVVAVIRNHVDVVAANPAQQFWETPVDLIGLAAVQRAHVVHQLAISLGCDFLAEIAGHLAKMRGGTVGEDRVDP